MNPGDSNQQWQQQQQQPQPQAHQHRQQHGERQQPTPNELAVQLVQKQYKLSQLMVKLARKHASNAQIQMRLLSFKNTLMAAEATRNEIAKTCNSMSDWAKQTQQKLDKTMGAAQMGKQHVENLKEIDEQKIRELELKLAQLPTEDELQQFAKKKREQQQELDDVNKKIKDLESKMGDEEEVLQQIRELQQSNAELEAELEKAQDQPKQSAEPPTSPDPEKNMKVFLENYFNVDVSQKGTTSADVTSTKIDPDDDKTEREDYPYSDDELSS